MGSLFDNVVFAKTASEKLASVGDLCDAGMVCVFTKQGLKTYKESDFCVQGDVFTYDERDRKTRLYPLTLFRKTNEKNIFDVETLAQDFSQDEEKTEKKLFLSLSPAVDLPATVPDGETLPTSLAVSKFVYFSFDTKFTSVLFRY